MLTALSVSLTGADEHGIERAMRSMRSQGFVQATSFTWSGGLVHAWAPAAQAGGEPTLLETTDGMACSVGPLWYRGRFGIAALESLLSEFAADEPLDELALRGNFTLFICAAGRCVLLNDLLGFARVYASSDRAYYCNSWLAASAYVGSIDLDASAAIEYVLLGASHSNRTPARQITKLPLASAFDLAGRCVQERHRAWLDGADRVPPTMGAAVDRIAAHLREMFAGVVAAYPGRTRMALSAGFDSRLILAGLLGAGERPDLFVYGEPTCVDVRVASAVAASLGLPLRAIDKAALARSRPEPDIQRLVANALFFDGLPNDGIWDRGVDLESRQAQLGGGTLGLNGGGGEIFRNFFHLPDRSCGAGDLVRAFYRGFDSSVFHRGGDLVEYEERLASALIVSLRGTGGGGLRFTRAEVELAYPLFRCHHWMAVNNSVAVRHGHFVTPLVDPVTTGLTWRLPLAWKNAGALESGLISALNHGVAALPSGYGFNFSDGPTTKARVVDWCNRARPVALRPAIGAVGRRMRRRRVSPTVLERCRALLPGQWCMDAWLDLRHLPDTQTLGRVMGLELVMRRMLT